MTAGSNDARKAQGFRKDALENAFREWLKRRLVRRKERVPETEPEPVYVEDENGVIDLVSQDPVPPSSFDPTGFPTPPGPRPSTKQRLAVLFYLQSGDRDEFKRKFEAVCDPNLQLAHLCGCGLASAQGVTGGTCVLASHLELVEAEVNRQHINIHFTLSQGVQTSADYLGIVQCLQGGRFCDLF